MKKIFLIIILILSYFFSEAQFGTIQPTNSPNILLQNVGGSRSTLFSGMAEFADTNAMKNGKSNFYASGILFDIANRTFYGYDSVNHYFYPFAIGSGSNQNIQQVLNTGNLQTRPDSIVGGGNPFWFSGQSSFGYATALSVGNPFFLYNNFAGEFDLRSLNSNSSSNPQRLQLLGNVDTTSFHFYSPNEMVYLNTGNGSSDFSGHGLRDSSGFMQYKDSTGHWISFSNIGGGTNYWTLSGSNLSNNSGSNTTINGKLNITNIPLGTVNDTLLLDSAGVVLKRVTQSCPAAVTSLSGWNVNNTSYPAVSINNFAPDNSTMGGIGTNANPAHVDTGNGLIATLREVDSASATSQPLLNGTGYVKQSGTTTSYITSIPNSDLANSTISGISLGSSLYQLNWGWGFLSSSPYNGSGTVNQNLDSSKVQPKITLTTTGTSGASTLTNDVLNIPQYSGGGGSALYFTKGVKKLGDSTTVIVDSSVVPTQSDLLNMPQINTWIPAQGVAASSNVTNYNYVAVDSVPYYFTTTAGGTGEENGGWLCSSTSGDSIRVQTPIGVMIGNSIIAGHPYFYSYLETNNLPNYKYNDPVGTMEHTLDSLTNFGWFNAGWGGEITAQIRARFMRDAIGVPGTNGYNSATTTVSHKPSCVVIEGGINDILANVPIQTIEANLSWMAEICAEYQVPCVMLNCVGNAYGPTTQPQLQEIAELNKWMASGILNQYGCTIIDINSMWNSGVYGGISTYGNDNIHYSSLVNPGDGVHFTQQGYDSVAKAIYKYAKLPKLVNITFSSALNPSTPIANYNRPTGITINNGYTGANNPSYTLANSAFDTIPVNSYVRDSMWIKITSSTNVTGSATQSGWNAIWFNLNNNTTNEKWYTQKTPFAGAQVGNINAASLNITQDSQATSQFYSLFQINGPYNSNVNNELNVKSNTSGVKMTIGDYTSGGVINNAMLSVYGGGAFNGQLYTNSTIQATGSGDSRIGLLDIGGSSANNPTYANNSIGMYQGSMRFVVPYQINYTTGLFSLANQYGNAIVLGGGGINSGVISNQMSYGNTVQTLDTMSMQTNTITINQPTSTLYTANNYFGVNFSRIINTNAVNSILFNTWASSGSNYFNTTNDGSKFSIGSIQANNASNYYGSMSPPVSAMLSVDDTTRGFMPPRMTTAQRNNIGGAKNIVITSAGSGYTTTPPTLTVTGGTGTGIRLSCGASGGVPVPFLLDGGHGYNPSSAVTGVVTGGNGSGFAFSITLGVDSGLVIFNTTVDSLQMYNGSSWVDLGNPPQIILATGTATLSSGTVTVSSSAVTSTCHIHLTYNTPSGTLASGLSAPSASRTANTSFVINSLTTAGIVNTLDNSTVDWEITN